MRNILIIGATGSLARAVIARAQRNRELQLTLFSRSRQGLPAGLRHIQGDALNPQNLTAAVAGQDVVYVNLAGELEPMARNIVAAMQAAGVRRLIAIASIGIYKEPIKPVLKPYRALADVVEASGLDYTLLRPDWFTDADEVNYQLTPKGQPERGGPVSRASIADFVCQLFADPAQHVGENLNISSP